MHCAHTVYFITDTDTVQEEQYDCNQLMTDLIIFSRCHNCVAPIENDLDLDGKFEGIAVAIFIIQTRPQVLVAMSLSYYKAWDIYEW